MRAARDRFDMNFWKGTLELVRTKHLQLPQTTTDKAGVRVRAERKQSNVVLRSGLLRDSVGRLQQTLSTLHRSIVCQFSVSILLQNDTVIFPMPSSSRPPATPATSQPWQFSLEFKRGS